MWATNPFAAALAEAEAAVRAAEPAVPPDLDAALAETLAEAEDAEAPEEIIVGSSSGSLRGAPGVARRGDAPRGARHDGPSHSSAPGGH